jgi:FkbM family methyltransferase
MGITVPVTLQLDGEIGGKICFHPSGHPHKIFLGYNPMPAPLVFKKYIKEGDVVFDVGANVGVFSIWFSRLCGTGKVFSFEPTKKTFTFLQKNIALNNIKNITPINAAVSDVDGRVEFLEHRYSDEQNFIEKRSTSSTRSVPSIRLDTYMDEKKVSKIDFLKIDTEGAELLVLQSLGKHIEDVKHIYFEYNEKNNGRYGYTGKDLICFLDKNEFDIFLPKSEKKELSLIPIEGHKAFGKKADLVAVRRHRV